MAAQPRRAPGGQTRDKHLVALVKAGASLGEAGSQFGISRERVRQVLERQGIRAAALPGRKEARARRKRHRIRENAKTIEAMWREGLTHEDIAHELNLSPGGVKELIHEVISREERLARGARKNSDRQQSPEEWALRALQDAARILERTPSSRAYDRLRNKGLIEGPARSTITTRFGWATACKMAGLTPNPRSPSPRSGARTYSDEDLREAMTRIARELGHPPSLTEYDARREEGEATAVTIRHRYGGWLRARAELLDGYDLSPTEAVGRS